MRFPRFIWAVSFVSTSVGTNAHDRSVDYRRQVRHSDRKKTRLGDNATSSIADVDAAAANGKSGKATSPTKDKPSKPDKSSKSDKPKSSKNKSSKKEPTQPSDDTISIPYEPLNTRTNYRPEILDPNYWHPAHSNFEIINWDKWESKCSNWFATQGMIYDPPQRTEKVTNFMKGDAMAWWQRSQLSPPTDWDDANLEVGNLSDDTMLRKLLGPHPDPDAIPEPLRNKLFWMEDNDLAEVLVSFNRGAWRKDSKKGRVIGLTYPGSDWTYSPNALGREVAIALSHRMIGWQASPNGKWIKLFQFSDPTDPEGHVSWLDIYVIQEGDIFKRPDGTIVEDFLPGDMIRYTFGREDPYDCSPENYNFQYPVRVVAELDEGTGMITTTKHYNRLLEEHLNVQPLADIHRRTLGLTNAVNLTDGEKWDFQVQFLSDIAYFSSAATPPHGDILANGPSEKCGDGVLTLTEECDDGNLIDGDGCSSKCKIENYKDTYLNPDYWHPKSSNFEIINWTKFEAKCGDSVPFTYDPPQQNSNLLQEKFYNIFGPGPLQWGRSDPLSDLVIREGAKPSIANVSDSNMRLFYGILGEAVNSTLVPEPLRNKAFWMQDNSGPEYLLSLNRAAWRDNVPGGRSTGLFNIGSDYTNAIHFSSFSLSETRFENAFVNLQVDPNGKYIKMFSVPFDPSNSTYAGDWLDMYIVQEGDTFTDTSGNILDYVQPGDIYRLTTTGRQDPYACYDDIQFSYFFRTVAILNEEDGEISQGPGYADLIKAVTSEPPEDVRVKTDNFETSRYMTTEEKWKFLTTYEPDKQMYKSSDATPPAALLNGL